MKSKTGVRVICIVLAVAFTVAILAGVITALR